MKRWIIGFLVLVFVFLTCGTFYLYFYGGLKYFIRAVSLIYKMPVEQKQKSWAELSGTDPRGAERGILAGTWGGRVWAWSTKGLKQYMVDEYSVYSVYDGCSDEVKAKLIKGEKNAIDKVIYSDFELWRENSRVGDYVAVYRAKPESGGTALNLREIYTYNFWLFMKKGINSECAK